MANTNAAAALLQLKYTNMELKIPGYWWNNCPAIEKKILYHGRIVQFDVNKMMFLVHVPSEKEHVFMTLDAALEYTTQ